MPSSSKAARRIRARLKRAGFTLKLKRSERDVGLDTSAGTRRTQRVQRRVPLVEGPLRALCARVAILIFWDGKLKESFLGALVPRGAISY